MKDKKPKEKKKRSWFTKRKMKEATLIEQTGTGRQRTLLTQTGRFNRYTQELESGCNAHTGEVLTDALLAYRAGYRNALGESASIHNRKQGKK